MNPRLARVLSRFQTREAAGASWRPGGAATPSKHAALEAAHFDAPKRDEAPRGQILIMFAIFLIGLMGMLGLATDVGFWAVARRTAQGAADAGAFAGARQIAMYTSTNPRSALADVTTVVGDHKLGSIGITIQRCEYINAMWSVVGTCDQTIPASAVGARIGTQMTAPTFFMRALSAFGAPTSTTVYGYAKARVEIAAKSPPDAPFMICGTKAWRVADKSGGAVNDTPSIFASGSTTTLNQSLVGSTFRIFDVNLTDVTKPNNLAVKGADCGSSKDDATGQGKFAGLADSAKNGNNKLGQKYNYVPAASTARPGNVLTKIDGAGGCKTGSIVSGCVMIIPVASSGESGSANQLAVNAYGAFKVVKVSDTQWNATLLYDYIISGPGTLYANTGTAWARDAINPVVIRLIW